MRFYLCKIFNQAKSLITSSKCQGCFNTLMRDKFKTRADCVRANAEGRNIEADEDEK